MNAAADAPSLPLQPITFGGVASFARARLKRLILVQFIVAVCAGVTMVFLAATVLAPVITQAIASLPGEGAVRDGSLVWSTNAPVKLGENPFLSIVVDPDENNDFGQTSDFQLELNHRQVKIRSLLGYLRVPYAGGWVIYLNRPEADPWWGARKPFILGGIGLGTVAGLFLCWGVLATVYSGPARLIAYFTDRDASWFGCWKLCGAALMTGALVFTLALWLYGCQQLPLVGLLLALLLHVLIGWAYVIVATLRLPLLADVRPKKVNPFRPADTTQTDPAPESAEGKAASTSKKTKPADSNPFRSG